METFIRLFLLSFIHLTKSFPEFREQLSYLESESVRTSRCSLLVLSRLTADAIQSESMKGASLYSAIPCRSFRYFRIFTRHSNKSLSSRQVKKEISKEWRNGRHESTLPPRFELPQRHLDGQPLTLLTPFPVTVDKTGSNQSRETELRTACRSGGWASVASWTSDN